MSESTDAAYAAYKEAVEVATPIRDEALTFAMQVFQDSLGYASATLRVTTENVWSDFNEAITDAFVGYIRAVEETFGDDNAD